MCEAALEKTQLCAIHLPITVSVEPDHRLVFLLYSAVCLFSTGVRKIVFTALLKMRRSRARCAKTRKLQKRKKKRRGTLGRKRQSSPSSLSLLLSWWCVLVCLWEFTPFTVCMLLQYHNNVWHRRGKSTPSGCVLLKNLHVMKHKIKPLLHKVNWASVLSSCLKKKPLVCVSFCRDPRWQFRLRSSPVASCRVPREVPI